MVNMKNTKILSTIFVLFAIFNYSYSAVTINQLTGITSSNLVFSGSIPISDSSSNQLFFTYYGIDGQTDQNSLKNSPLIIAVGAPGSSSQYLNFGSLGPLTLNNDMTTVANPNRFTQFANVMFIDLLGSGFSFANSSNDLPTDVLTYGVQLTYSINQFAKQSVLGQSKTIVIVGEGTFLRAIPGLDDIDALKGIVHISSWPQLYAVGKYYGVAGPDLKIFGDSQRIAIQTTFVSCYNYVRNQKYLQAHSCYDSILNFVQSKTKNCNLYSTQLGSNLTQSLPMIQYYMSQSATVSKYKAPTTRMFETQSNWIVNKTYVDMAKNKTANLSQYMKDYLTVKHWFVSGNKDYIAYTKSLKNWLQTQLSFVESSDFTKAKLEDVVVDGSVVGYSKGVKQVRYTQIIDSGHYISKDQPKVFSKLFQDWLSNLGNNQIRTEDLIEVQE